VHSGYLTSSGSSLATIDVNIVRVSVMSQFVRKRDGKLAKFDPNRIRDALQKAFASVGATDDIDKLTEEVVRKIKRKYGAEGVPTVEEIQDIVEKVLIRHNYHEVARAFILYREQRRIMRELAYLLESGDVVDEYLQRASWYIRENANIGYSMQGLNCYLVHRSISEYWLMRIYPPEIRRAHKIGDFHIHDLGVLGPYCVGWDLRQLLLNGFGALFGKIHSKPPKHFSSALGQVVNFLYTMQGEAAGAQAINNLDTYLAPFIRYDKLNYESAKQEIQEFLFNMNVPTRVGFQTPFTNVTMDIIPPNFMKDEAIIIDGKLQNDVYDNFVDEQLMFNQIYNEVMLEGDADNRIFTFPIVTYNVTNNFPWNDKTLWSLVAKYGSPYFANFISSEMRPEDVRSMCCRLRLDTRQLIHKGGGYFGANPLTGSIGVVTINLPRIGYLSKDDDEFFERLDELILLAKSSLELKRKTIEKLTEDGLYPYSKMHLRSIKELFGSYWANHFNTIGLVGGHECCLNFLGTGIDSADGVAFMTEVLTFMRERLMDFQEEESNILWNLEATPAEGASYRLAMLDSATFDDIIVSGVKIPFYTNSTQLPANSDYGLVDALNHQSQLQSLYTGGTVFHIWMGEAVSSWKACSKLVRRIFETYSLPYITITPTFSICPNDGYLSGEYFNCPSCGSLCEVYSRITGYYRPVQNWNDGKQEEFRLRKTFDTSVDL